MHSRSMIKPDHRELISIDRIGIPVLLNCNYRVDHGDRKEYRNEEHSKQDDAGEGCGADKSLTIPSADTAT